MHILLISLLDRHVDWDGLEVLPMSIAISILHVSMLTHDKTYGCFYSVAA